MLVPTRLLVIHRLCDLIEDTPLTINDEVQDLKGFVARGRNLVGDERKGGPFIAILESPRPDFAIYAGEDEAYRKDRLTLLFQGTIDDDKLNPSDNAYYFCAAVEQRLSQIIELGKQGLPKYPESYMLGNLITSLEIGAPVVRPPDDRASSSAFFFLPVRVGIAVEIKSPYTSVS